MKKRAQIVADLSKAATFDDQVRLVAELDALDRQAVVAAQAARDNDWTEDVVRQTLTPVRIHEMHTAATEWLDHVDTSGSDYHTKIIAEAAMWYGRVSPEVKADNEEFTIQAQGMIRRQASVYGEHADAAAAAATEYLSFLRRREGASGLPQIEQTVAPDGVTNQPTPIPPDVFDNFAPPIHPINEAVSGTEDSNRAPLLQENAPGMGQQETLHSEAPMVDEGPAPFSTTSVAIGHVMNMREFADLQRREAAAATDPRVAAGETTAAPWPTHRGIPWGNDPEFEEEDCRICGGADHTTSEHEWGEYGKTSRKTAADGDSSQSADSRYAPGTGSADQNGSAAMDRLVEATGLSAEEVRQRFNDPQEAVKVLDSLAETGQSKAASKTAGDDSDAWLDGLCDTCDGSGRVDANASNARVHEIKKEKCPDCGGSGQKTASKRVCSPCTNGNHSGTNGTPGCSGGNCACTAQGCGKNSGGGTGSGNKEASLQTEAVYHESYGELSRAQLAAYRKHNISPSDHDDLTRHFGNDPVAITKWVKDQAADNDGRVSTYGLGRWNEGGFGRFSGSKEAASTLDQIQQTTAPDGVTQKPTPLPGEVAFPLIDNTEMTSDQLVDPDPRAAVEKAAALDDASSTSCRSCGESISSAGDGKPSTCSNCGVKNYVQRKASRSFTPDDAMAHPEFFKGYGFGRNWKTGSALVRTGTAEFEAGLYAGITDNPENQAGWLAAHAVQARKFEEFSARIAVHDRFTQKVAGLKGLRTTASYVTATTETDLATTSPGTSPSPTGDTPINGPGKPGPLAGYETPAEAGGPGPYNGAPPYGRPVVPGAIAPAQIVPPEVTHSGPPNPLANQQTVAFRRQIQAGLVRLAQKG